MILIELYQNMSDGTDLFVLHVYTLSVKRNLSPLQGDAH